MDASMTRGRRVDYGVLEETTWTTLSITSSHNSTVLNRKGEAISLSYGSSQIAVANRCPSESLHETTYVHVVLPAPNSSLIVMLPDGARA
jgi:hypothetical protein